MSMMPDQEDLESFELERQESNELLDAADRAAKEGVLVAERLRVATQQYRDRLNSKKGRTFEPR